MRVCVFTLFLPVPTTNFLELFFFKQLAVVNSMGGEWKSWEKQFIYFQQTKKGRSIVRNNERNFRERERKKTNNSRFLNDAGKN